MNRYLRWGLAALAVVLLAGLLVLFLAVPRLVMNHENSTIDPGPYAVSDAARALHQQLLVADLHCDALLWCRDLAVRDSAGHVDLPRLREGNVALQFFTVVTRVPSGQNMKSNADGRDQLTPLCFAQRWPSYTWFSSHGRAVYQAKRLQALAQEQANRFLLVRNQQELKTFLGQRKQHPELAAGILGIEGLHCLEGDLRHLDEFYDLGYRMMAFSHFFDTDLGGSAHGTEKGGITDFGKQVLRAMEERQIILDLAHASPALVDDTLDLATRPVFVSHTGVRGVSDSNRNLSDEQVKRIAAGGGLIGIGFFKPAIAEESVAGIIAAVRYVTDLVGAEHVALGSDFDGAIVAPFDAGGMGLVTQGLLAAGFSEDEIGHIMGGNVLRLLGVLLPPN